MALEELNVNATITVQRSGRPRGQPILIEAILKAPKIAMLMISLRRDLMVSEEDELGRAPGDRARHKKSLVKAILSHPTYEQGSSYESNVFWRLQRLYSR